MAKRTTKKTPALAKVVKGYGKKSRYLDVGFRKGRNGDGTGGSTFDLKNAKLLAKATGARVVRV